MVADYKWGNFDRFIDVGGAHGSVLAALLRAHPQASGVLFDLPQVRSCCVPAPSLADLNLLDAVSFESVPR